MKIGQLAATSGVPASTIRFYEQKGLMPPATRRANGYREYDAAALQRLQLIKFSQGLGFSLDELPGLLTHQDGFDHDMIMQRLTRKAAEVDEMLTRLTTQKARIATLMERLDYHWSRGDCMPQDELACQVADIDLTV